VFLKLEVENNDKIVTQHYYFGPKGHIKKSHIFKRFNQKQYYESKDTHLSANEAMGNIKQIVGVAIEKDVIHSFGINVDEAEMNTRT
jgi:hypothetical protein